VNAPFVQPTAPVKSTVVAYVLWFFFGGVGAHKFYLGRPALGLLYICMLVAFWYGLISVSVDAVGSAVDAINLSIEQGNPVAPRLGRPRMSYSLMMMPLSLALLYDLVTLPSQVRAANDRLAAGGIQTASLSPSKSIFGGKDLDAELSAKKADEAVARYIARQTQSAPTTRPATQATSSGTPTFGRRGR